jgi:histidine triad (HIT) family protein
VAGDVPGQIIDSDEHTVAFMDINPATRGHALVVPRQHSADLMDISDEDLERTMLAAQRLARRIDEVLEPDGFNLLNSCRSAAWQTVFHFHVHVIPRYQDDPLKLPWVPGPGDEEEIAGVAEQLRRS